MRSDYFCSEISLELLTNWICSIEFPTEGMDVELVFPAYDCSFWHFILNLCWEVAYSLVIVPVKSQCQHLDFSPKPTSPMSSDRGSLTVINFPPDIQKLFLNKLLLYGRSVRAGHSMFCHGWLRIAATGEGSGFETPQLSKKAPRPHDKQPLHSLQVSPSFQGWPRSLTCAWKQSWWPYKQNFPVDRHMRTKKALLMQSWGHS